jgi:hypothetical protein
MPFITSNASPDLIRTAAKLHHLDDACRLIQGSLGIETEDIAGQFFSGAKAHEWPSLSEVSRRRLLVDYVSTEQRAAHA